jgi:hypothetical protein
VSGRQEVGDFWNLLLGLLTGPGHPMGLSSLLNSGDMGAL